MPRLLPTLALALLPFLVLAGPPQTVVLDVQNMTCPVCPITVRRALEKVPGVVTAKVDLERKTATVTLDPERVQPAALVKATTDAGYPSTVHP